jgi:hypothetical protein
MAFSGSASRALQDGQVMESDIAAPRIEVSPWRQDLKNV